MSTADLHTERDAAATVRSAYTASLEEIRANRDLSEEGRQRNMAAAYVKAKQRLDELAGTEAKRLAELSASLENHLYGARGAARGNDGATHAISARDASDRAARVVSPAEASELLTRANADGDELLARAVARQCMRRSETGGMRRQDVAAWEDAARIFFDARPQLASTVSELAEIERMTKRQILSPFSLPVPYGVTPAQIHTSQREGAAPERWLTGV